MADVATKTVFERVSELLTPSERFIDAAFAVEAGRFVWVGARAALPETYSGWPKVDLGDNAVLPGLIDSHTHLVWAGSRVEEFACRSRGASYEELLAAGGGIHSTVSATRGADRGALLEAAIDRARAFLRGGVTTLEVKSGYGLTTEAELEQLAVARRLGDATRQRVTTTLLAHVPDPDVDRGVAVDRFVMETIPEAARAGLADAFDVFVDRGAFTLEEARRLLVAAKQEGLGLKGHVEQLSRTGGAALLAELGALSADHLELAEEADLTALASAGVVATILPGAAVGLGAGLPAPDALRRSGVTLAVASDSNPGSSPMLGLLPAAQLAIAVFGFTVDEVLAGITTGAAAALGRDDVGAIAPGMQADFTVVSGREALLPLYRWGEPPVASAYVGGELVYSRSTD